MIARAARLVHVEKRDDVTLVKRIAFNVSEGSTQLRDASHGDVTGDQRIRHAGQLAAMEMHIGATHFRKQYVEQRGAALDLGARQFGKTNRLVRRRDGGSKHG